jgi:hypothetical protein
MTDGMMTRESPVSPNTVTYKADMEPRANKLQRKYPSTRMYVTDSNALRSGVKDMGQIINPWLTEVLREAKQERQMERI